MLKDKDYEFIEEIASGGMAIIHKARQPSLERLVAIKELKHSLREDEEVIQRFEREAKAAANLRHENIITVYDYWHPKQGSYYIAMEYIQGANLSEILQKVSPLPLDIGLIISLKIARALEYAHSQGVVHRDIKPSNIMLSQEGMVKLTDFGIAHIEEAVMGEEEKVLTRKGVFLGTPAYMPPEQIAREPVDWRADIFSFGIVLYEIFSGQKPFKDDETSTMVSKILKGKFTPPRKLNKTIPRPLQRIIKRCLKPKPSRRFSSTTLLRARLQGLTQKQIKKGEYEIMLRSFLIKEGIVKEDEDTKRFKPPKPLRIPGLGIPWRLIGMVVLMILGCIYLFYIQPSDIQSLLNFLRPALQRGEQKAPVPPSQPQSIVEKPPSPAKPAPAPLKEEYGYIRVVASPWADVYLDKEKVLVTPTDRKLKVAVGEHRIELKNPYYQKVSQKVWVTKDEVKFIKVKLEKKKKSKQSAR